MPPVTAPASQALNDLIKQQVDAFRQLREQRPKYICSFPFLFTGTPLIKLKDVDGEFATLKAQVFWTPPCLERIKNEEIKYISAEFDRDYYWEKTGKHIGFCLLAIGATNRPFVKGMAPIALNDDGVSSDINVITTGHWYHEWYGEITITPEDLDEAVENFSVSLSHVSPDAPNPPTELCVDYNHGSLSYGADNMVAAGWVKGKGIWVNKTKTKATQPATHPERPQLNTPAKPEQTPAQVPEGDTAMNDKLIREVLGLSEGTAITDEHRNLAFTKLHEDNKKLTQGHQALVAVVGDVSPDQLSVTLKEGKINAHVLVTAEEHAKLLKAQTDLSVVNATGEANPTKINDKFVLTEVQFNDLQAKANAGEQAAKDLLALKVETFLNDNMKKFTHAQREGLKNNLLKDFATWSEDIKNRPDLDALLEKEVGSGGNGNNSAEANQVADFVAQREEHHVTTSKLGKADAYSLACKDAKTKFGADAFAEYEDMLDKKASKSKAA